MFCKYFSLLLLLLSLSQQTITASKAIANVPGGTHLQPVPSASARLERMAFNNIGFANDNMSAKNFITPSSTNRPPNSSKNRKRSRILGFESLLSPQPFSSIVRIYSKEKAVFAFAWRITVNTRFLPPYVKIKTQYLSKNFCSSVFYWQS